MKLTNAFPKIRLMIDAGAKFHDWRGMARVDAVIGSESLQDVETLRVARDDSDFVLSLDFRDPTFLGSRGVALDARAMAAAGHRHDARAGRLRAGPDIERVSNIVARAGDRRVYAAGGLRGAGDLARLEAVGAAGALVATALHDGRLTRSEHTTVSTQRPAKKREPRGSLGSFGKRSAADQFAAKGCFAVTRAESTLRAVGSPFIARAMASFVAA